MSAGLLISFVTVRQDGSEFVGVRRHCRIIDDQGQVRLAVDREYRVFEGEGVENWVINVLDGISGCFGGAFAAGP